MRLNKKWSMLALALFLILYGLRVFIPALAGLETVLALLAIVAGVLIGLNM